MGGSPSEDGVPPVPSHGRTDGNGNPDDEEDLLQVRQERITPEQQYLPDRCRTVMLW